MSLKDVLKSRKKKAQNLLSQTSAKGWLVISKGNDPNLEYLVGAHPHNTTIALLTEDELKVIASSLEESIVSKDHVDNISTYYGQSELTKELHSLMREMKKNLLLLGNAPAFVSSHAANILASHEKIITKIGGLYGIEFKPVDTFLKELRTRKTRAEQKTCKEAVNKSVHIINQVIQRKTKKITEKELAAEIYKEAYAYGSPAFDPIVAFGQATRNPHYIPQEHTLEGNEIFYIDVGVKYNSMCGDITRTYFLSEPTEKQKAAYEAVKAAQDEAISLAVNNYGEGVAVRDLDIKAREVIEEKGFDPDKFSHALGHAVGVEAHDVGPSLYKKRDKSKKLKAGQLYTIEPALYFEEWGIRLEDNILIKKDSVERLSNAPQSPPILDLS